MKKLTVPGYSLSLVLELSRQVKTKADAKRLWARTDGRPRQLKDSFTNLLKLEQGHRCAYCGIRLHEENPHRDHIAPKSIHYRWAFWPENIVLACYACNVDSKESYESVLVKSSKYSRCQFSMIHPYLDDPTDHIKFIGHRTSILICPVNGSAKGRETIRLFKLMSPYRVKQRAKDVLFDQDVGYLHGKYRRLVEQVVFSPVPRRMLMKRT
ncbi:HNH endonuclease [Rhizobium phaseoli]|uniref:HNH endonuclease n=1 Tax=Rhizobium phaseoli TaxID=396 RepID=UPI0007EC185D|nr:HNH endonuclease [Rhizobium phaseoli]ANL33930.1 hypothetical protein AMC89_CH01857 [Rhizobium phaseoli]ANL97655.1 hypothetical protein AMC79_CH01852 [Rhizobium phaseoli]